MTEPTKRDLDIQKGREAMLYIALALGLTSEQVREGLLWAVNGAETARDYDPAADPNDCVEVVDDHKDYDHGQD